MTERRIETVIEIDAPPSLTFLRPLRKAGCRRITFKAIRGYLLVFELLMSPLLELLRVTVLRMYSHSLL